MQILPYQPGMGILVLVLKQDKGEDLVIIGLASTLGRTTEQFSQVGSPKGIN